MATEEQPKASSPKPAIPVRTRPKDDVVEVDTTGVPQPKDQTEPIPPERPGLAETKPKLFGTILLILTAAIPVAGWFLQAGTNWLVVLGLIAIFFLAVGKGLTNRALGVLINERRLMSLSRFQLVIWTVLIVSGFFVIALERIHSAQVEQPLAIGVDWQIWTLLGISTGSLLGTPLLYGNKREKEPKKKAELIQKTAKRFKEEPQDVENNRQGVLYGNSCTGFARFTDMFQGDELGNAHLVDVAKVQMFFFTIVVAIAYGTQLFQLIAYGELYSSNVRLPELQDGLLALMGVSHAGYLGAKGVNQTPTTE